MIQSKMSRVLKLRNHGTFLNGDSSCRVRNQHEELLFEHHEESRVMHEAGRGFTVILRSKMRLKITANV